jgi:hypothetical protein
MEFDFLRRLRGALELKREVDLGVCWKLENGSGNTESAMVVQYAKVCRSKMQIQVGI